MHKLIALALLAVAALVAGPVRAADLPYYPPVIEVPDVDYGVAGNFYLRGSVGGNLMWAHDVEHPCGCFTTTPIDDAGYGYSLGAGFGYETGTGLRTDFTVDYLRNTGMTSGGYDLDLRSTLAMVNVYYDFGFSGLGSAAGGFGAYVGAGLGAGFNHTEVNGPLATPDGDTVAAAAAVMAGVTYDMGSVVADVGYRGIYMPTVTNGDAAVSPFYINDDWIHEVRGTVRYRF
jgi:hypothetical protein